MMYHKAKLFGDEKACKKILLASNSGEAKAIGLEVIGLNLLGYALMEVRDQLMS